MLRVLAPFLIKYFTKLKLVFHDAISLSGFMIFMIIYSQIISGMMLAFSYVPESMNIPLSREEEDMEVRYIDDFFFIHERGVDLLELFLFIHLLRKLYLNLSDSEQEFSWKTGVFLFIVLQVVIFTGLVLCCTHLSDITLLVFCNMIHSFFLFIGKLYWVVFPDKTLNVDTVTRLAYLHFFLGILISFFVVYHGVDMHHDWKTDNNFVGFLPEIDWFDEALVNEVGQCLDFLLVFGFLSIYLFSQPESLSYEIFTWGDVGMITDIRFFGIAPHWYFRPYMSWLLVCPLHYTGIFGIIVFFLAFYYQPNLVGRDSLDSYQTAKNTVISFLTSFKLIKKTFSFIYKIVPDTDLFYCMTYSLFIISLWYTFSYLPYGRFFNRLGGNDITLLAFAYIYIYLGGPLLRSSNLYSVRKTLIIKIDYFTKDIYVGQSGWTHFRN